MSARTVQRTAITCDGCQRIGPPVEGGPIEASSRYETLGWEVGANGDRCPECVPFDGPVIACSEFLCENRRKAEEPRPDAWLVLRAGEQEREREFCSAKCLSQMLYCSASSDNCK